jgi:penicillin-binding protein 1A
MMVARRVVNWFKIVRGLPVIVSIAVATAFPAAAQQPGAPTTPPASTPAPDTGAANAGAAWRITEPPQSTLVYARDGSLIGEIGRELRTSVPLASLPAYVPQAFIAIEDRRFYQHNGVDMIGVFGAIKDGMIGRGLRGASTITQQLVGNLHPDLINRRDMTIDRKLREQDAAREMERHYTKAQILEAYLNQIPFGHGWFGIDAASRHYFGKPAGRLSLAEAATLAALPRSAPYYDPIRHPDRARSRRNLVLSQMASQGLITTADAAAAEGQPVVTVAPDVVAPAPYFVDAVRTVALAEGVPVDSGGYRLYSTLDPAEQRAAVTALAEGTAALEARPGYRHPTLASHPKETANYLQGVVVALEAATGEVRVLVGGRDYQDSPFDRAILAARQPGSAFKPIVYAAAIADSIPPNAAVYDTAIAIRQANGTVYRPDDADGKFLGAMSMREALVDSRNSVAVQLALRVGLDSVIALARRVGITTPIAPVPASAIGASGVHPIDLVAAYGAFATLGQVTQPQFLTRIDDRSGRLVWAPHVLIMAPALDSNVAFIVGDMMRDVIERGTASEAHGLLPPSLAVAGKTGTTNDNTDLWFVGYTPELVAGVWLGFDQPQPIAKGVAGGTSAAPIWARFIAAIYAGPGPDSGGTWVTQLPAPPLGLVMAELDRVTGTVADSTTPIGNRYKEYFLPGTEPAALRFDPRSLFADGPLALH